MESKVMGKGFIFNETIVALILIAILLERVLVQQNVKPIFVFSKYW
jgi:hypothetical protein